MDIYTHVSLHTVIYNWTSVSKISFLRFKTNRVSPKVQHGWLWSFSAWLQGTWYFWCHHLCGWLWHGNELQGCASTLQWCLCPKKRWGGVNLTGRWWISWESKWCWENEMFWMSLKISMVFWRLHSGKNGVAKRKGRYTQHLGIPNKQVSIYVYMPLFKVRSISCVSSNFFIEQTGCFWLPYQISISKAVSFGTSFRKKPQRWQRSLWCWPSMQRTTVCPPMMMSAS